MTDWRLARLERRLQLRVQPLIGSLKMRKESCVVKEEKRRRDACTRISRVHQITIAKILFFGMKEKKNISPLDR